MSTRCNIIIKDSNQKLFFYRHSDGYPETTAASLEVFMDMVRQKKIRDNVGQATGWLVLLGNAEYKQEGYCGFIDRDLNHRSAEGKSDYSSWKCGAYEPTDGIHSDIEFLYELDLEAKTVKGWTHNGEVKGSLVYTSTDKVILETVGI